MFKSTLALVAILGLAACGGGGGSNGGTTTPPTRPVVERPASNSTADLVAFAAGGRSTSAYSDIDGVSAKTRSYTQGGVDRDVTYARNGDTGLLTATGNGTRYEVVGADPNGSVGSAYYTGNISGSYKVAGGQEVQIVSGASVAAINVDVATGKANMGADMWGTRTTGKNDVMGIGLAASGGVVNGNTVVWNDAKVIEMRDAGVVRTGNTADMTTVFSDDARTVFGTIKGGDMTSGFGVNAGFIADEFVGN
ncbi:hypothetical protein [Paracoccus sp. ME4]|uniref:hypothetical protein n=1 Tax=Paracoccus sp. ME4 TaxID=3138066 RepID=UPI00398B5D7C